jgi:hypothetical protein
MFGSKFLFENIEKYFLTKNHIGFSKQVIIYLNTYASVTSITVPFPFEEFPSFEGVDNCALKYSSTNKL